MDSARARSTRACARSSPIAEWVGHQDGGILIGRVYGHLANEHPQRMAQRLSFTPTLIDLSDKAANA